MIGLLGERWRPGVTALQLLALTAVVRTFSSTSGEVFQALDRPQLTAYTETAHFALLVPALAVGPHWQGLEGAAAAVVLADAAVGVPVLAVIMRVLSVGLRELGAPCYGPPPDGRASLSPYLRGVNCSEGCPKASS